MTTANSAGRIETPNGVPIYFEVHGNGEPLLLLHGFSGCSQDRLQLMRGEVSGGRYKGSESKRGLALARPVGGKIKVNPPSKPRVGHPNSIGEIMSQPFVVDGCVAGGGFVVSRVESEYTLRKSGGQIRKTGPNVKCSTPACDENNLGAKRMRNRFIGFRVLLCAFTLALLCANGLWAQSQSAEKPPLYTYVSEWTVPRAMWADYLKNDATDIEVLKKALADGTLISFGSYAILNHQEGQPTHGTWFSASSMANILKVLEGLRTAPAATAPPLAAAKHWDYILSSRNYSSHSGTFTNGYLRVGNWRAKAGSSDPDGKIMKATMVALLEKLLADGALHGYQIDEETVHSADPGAYFIAIITNGPEGIDKFNAAIDESEKNNPAGWAGYGSTVDFAGHRDTLARVSIMTHK